MLRFIVKIEISSTIKSIHKGYYARKDYRY